MRTPLQFFTEEAGYCYKPDTETPEEGRARCAAILVEAEAWARDEGCTFGWLPDDSCDSSEWSDDTPPWGLWICDMYDADGAHVQSLSGIDFGRDGSPWRDSYKRVVEAELASQHRDMVQA